jgi:hypothetical protein
MYVDCIPLTTTTNVILEKYRTCSLLLVERVFSNITNEVLFSKSTKNDATSEPTILCKTNRIKTESSKLSQPNNDTDKQNQLITGTKSRLNPDKVSKSNKNQISNKKTHKHHESKNNFKKIKNNPIWGWLLNLRIKHLFESEKHPKCFIFSSSKFLL